MNFMSPRQGIALSVCLLRTCQVVKGNTWLAASKVSVSPVILAERQGWYGCPNIVTPQGLACTSLQTGTGVGLRSCHGELRLHPMRGTLKHLIGRARCVGQVLNFPNLMLMEGYQWWCWKNRLGQDTLFPYCVGIMLAGC